MTDQGNQVTCNSCGNSYSKDDLQRDCSNCFACTGCEIYICPSCRGEIVVRPVKRPDIK